MLTPEVYETSVTPRIGSQHPTANKEYPITKERERGKRMVGPKGLPFAAFRALGSWEFLVGCWILKRSLRPLEGCQLIGANCEVLTFERYQFFFSPHTPTQSLSPIQPFATFACFLYKIFFSLSPFFVPFRVFRGYLSSLSLIDSA